MATIWRENGTARIGDDRSERPGWTKRPLALASCAVALGLLASPPLVAANANANGNSFQVTALSTQPHLVTGGDVLVRVEVPKQFAASAVKVSLNGADITSRFKADAGGQSLTGLVTGLALGENTIEASAARGNNGGGPSKRLKVTNYPITGPILSGPHESPFFCQTTQFNLPVTGGNLGAPIDASCSIATRVDYVYSANGTSFLPLNVAGGVPADVVNTTTNAGTTVRFIVRVETGTINRAVYQIAILHDPFIEQAPRWDLPTQGWNRKLIYQHGGGCQGGWYRQGANTGGVLNATQLGRGFARASSSLNVFGNNCNDLLASESSIMVKERFIEGYGVPKWTIGTGSSGGAYQSNQTADNYPGMFDGIITMSSFPDVTTGAVTLHDSRLLDIFFNNTAPGQFNEAKQKAISGYLQVNEIVFLSRSAGTSALRLDPDAVFNAVVPVADRYDPVSNPDGARATIYDHTINVYGYGGNGFALRPLDNVGVQYGLKALNDGAISVDEFLLLNEKIGGVDIDFNHTASRTVADPGALHRAYVSGRVLNGGGGLKNIPIITQHGAGDPVVNGDIHLKFYSWSIRERLRDANGHVGNQAIVAPFGNRDDMFAQMNAWLDAIHADTSNLPQWRKVVANRPADVLDSCWIGGVRVIDSPSSPYVPSPCNNAYPAGMTPNLVAGAPIQGAIHKCQLKPVDPADYTVTFTSAQWTRLLQIFAGGVCDWSKPGVEQTDLTTWASFGPSPKKLVFDVLEQ
jgi:hypothetical protein